MLQFTIYIQQSQIKKKIEHVLCNAIFGISANELLKVKGNLETWKLVSETLVVALPRIERLNVRV